MFDENAADALATPANDNMPPYELTDELRERIHAHIETNGLPDQPTPLILTLVEQDA